MVHEETTSIEGLDFVVDWRSTAPEHAAAITSFWLREAALGDEAQARARLPQVVLHAQDKAGTVVAVCTALATLSERVGERLFYYRAFVAAPWRKHGIAIVMLQRARQCLGDFARARNFPCIGMLVEIQSRELQEIGNRPYWPRTHFTYIGKDAAGLKLFVHYFDGAMLHS